MGKLRTLLSLSPSLPKSSSIIWIFVFTVFVKSSNPGVISTATLSWLINTLNHEQETSILLHEVEEELNLNPYELSSGNLEDAINAMDINAVVSLLRQGADVNARNIKLETPLHRAAVSSNMGFALDTIKLLLDHRANPTLRDQYDYTFLDRLVNDGTTLTSTQFHVLAVFLMSRNLTKLFNTPADIPRSFVILPRRWVHEYTLSTPFQMAVKNIEIGEEMLHVLQRSGVNLNAVDSEGDSTLYYALMGNRTTKLISNLISLGANWKTLNKRNESLLHDAAQIGSIDHVSIFFNLGLGVNEVDEFGQTALHYAVRFSTRDVLEKVRFFIRNGAEVKTTDRLGVSPYDDALRRNDLKPNDKQELVRLVRDCSFKCARG